MTLASQRSLVEMKPVLKDPGASGPDPVYWVFSHISPHWENLTIITPGKIGTEYPKTFGHYHGTPVPEIYHKVQGEGVLLLQKKHFDNSVWKPEVVDEVLLVKVGLNDEVIIKPEYGHSWTNLSPEPLILYDNWQSGHQHSDYDQIEKLHGLAYYLIEENNQVKAVPNPSYSSLPQPVWLSSQELAARNH